MHLPPTPTLIKPPPEPRRAVSVVLDELVSDHPHERIKLAEVVAKLGDRTFGLLLLLFSVLNLVPAINMLFGLVTALLGLQLLFGFDAPWLPKRILTIALPVSATDAVIDRIIPRVKWLERFIRPRWHWTEAPLVDNVIGLMVFGLGIVITIPVPLSNGLPALVTGLIGFGLAARDGLLQCIGFVAGIGTLFIMSGLIITVTKQIGAFIG